LFFKSKPNKSVKLPSFNEASNLNNDPWAIVFLSYIISLSALPSLSLRVVFYALILILLIYVAVFRNLTIKLDWFFALLLYMLMLSGFLAIRGNSTLLLETINIGSSLILVALTSVFGVNRRSIVIATTIILVIYLIREPQILIHLKWIFIDYQNYNILFVNTSHSLTFLMLIMAVYFMLLGKAKYMLLILIVSLPFVSRSGLLAFSIVAILFYLKNYIPPLIIRFLPVLLILVVLVVIFIIGIFFPQDALFIKLSTMRSIFYEVITNDIMNRGIDIAFPKYAGYTSETLTQQVKYYFNSETPYYSQFLRVSNKGCVHSYFLEILSDYGAIFFVLMLFFFYKMTNLTNMYVTIFYIIFVSFQCGGFNPALIFPFYIFYYLSTRLSNHESNFTGYKE